MNVLFLRGKNNKNGFRIWAWLSPCGEWKEMFTPFYREWGVVYLSFHIMKYRLDIRVAYGKKCTGVPRWAQ